MSFPIANRSESGDPEGEANPEGEAEIRGETGIEGLKSGQRARGVDIADAEAKRISEELRAERTLRTIQRDVEKAGREQRPHDGCPATIVMGQ